jgi:hypothetical protein
VGRFGVTKDHVASFLHVDFITEAAQGLRGLRSGDDGQFDQPATWMTSSSIPGGDGFAVLLEALQVEFDRFADVCLSLGAGCAL